MKVHGTKEELLRALGAIPISQRTPACNEIQWHLQDDGMPKGVRVAIDINDEYAAKTINAMLVANRIES